MKVIELLFSVDRNELLDRWKELYTNNFSGEDEHGSREFEERRAGLAYIDRVLTTLKQSVPERTDMKVLVETYRAKWVEEGRPKEHWMNEARENGVNVSGYGGTSDELDYKGEPYPPDTRWSLSLTPWGQWREMEVVQNEHDATMDDVTLAAHIIEEMTWYGLPEAQEGVRDKLLDSVERVNRAFDTGDMTGFRPLDQGFFDEVV